MILIKWRWKGFLGIESRSFWLGSGEDSGDLCSLEAGVGLCMDRLVLKTWTKLQVVPGGILSFRELMMEFFSVENFTHNLLSQCSVEYGNSEVFKKPYLLKVAWDLQLNGVCDSGRERVLAEDLGSRGDIHSRGLSWVLPLFSPMKLIYEIGKHSSQWWCFSYFYVSSTESVMSEAWSTAFYSWQHAATSWCYLVLARFVWGREYRNHPHFSDKEHWLRSRVESKLTQITVAELRLEHRFPNI